MSRIDNVNNFRYIFRTMPHRTKKKRKKSRAIAAAKEVIAKRKRRRAKAIRLSKQEKLAEKAA